MIKVLGKVLGVLERVALESPEPVALGRLAEELGLNKATCSRIVKDLVEAGYLVRVSRLEGYAVGPRAFALRGSVRYKPVLIAAAEVTVRRIAELIGESVLLAELHARQRYILAHHNANPAMRINLGSMAYDDLSSTATGIILLAYCPPHEAGKIVAGANPKGFLNTARDGMKAQAFLDKVRREGVFVYEGAAHPFAVTAVPVFQNGRFIAALGASAPREGFNEKQRKDILRGIKAGALEISNAVSTARTVG